MLPDGAMLSLCSAASCAKESDAISTHRSSVRTRKGVSHLGTPIVPDTTLERHITTELRNRDEETKASGNIKNALSIRTRDAVVQFGEISEPDPEPERTVLTVQFGVLQGENQNRTEKPIISESG
jgi:hypothetical protein